MLSEPAYWAHSPNETGRPDLLLEHLERVAKLCEQFASRFGAGSWGRIAGLWHDLGKFSREFQAYLRAPDNTPTVDHSTAGAQHAVTHAGEVGKLLAYCIAGHHGGMPNYSTDGQGSTLSERLSKEIPDYLSHAPPDLLALQPDRSLPFLPDRDEAIFQLSFLTRILFSALVDADFLATEQFFDRSQSARRRPGASINELTRVLQAHLDRLQATAPPTEVNRLRRDILASCIEAASWAPGFFSLTVPTGGGKTLASLMWALLHAQQYGHDRVIVVLPYMNIIEQTAAIFRGVFRQFGGATVIEHHSTAEYDGHNIALRLATENWDATIIVTTAVQFFDSLYANKPSKCRKLHRIARSIVILDEPQTLPVGLLAPCLSALRALVKGYQTSVLLCTATQPALNRGENFPVGLSGVREIISQPTWLYNAMRRVEVQYVGDLPDAPLLQRLSALEQVLCVVNTTKHAARLGTALASEGTYHLSARMCPVHRSEVLAVIRTRLADGLPCRVVSTQVIECGVDIDFPVVYRALCGLDSLAQSAGRCNREGRLERREVIFFFPEELIPNMLHSPANATRQILPDYLADPLSLEAVDHFFHQYYWSKADYDRQEILPELTGRGVGNFQFAQAARFALIDSPTQPVIVPWGAAGETVCHHLRRLDLRGRPGLLRRLTRKAQRYSVNVYPKELETMLAAGTIETAHESFLILSDPQLYSPRLGLLRQDAGGDVPYEIG